ncbi:MAG: helix-turn-helix domain-containing protein [Clostridia bacterium]|nr:helix-turn-helix domain-containing protein [Clostridia bacterium]
MDQVKIGSFLKELRKEKGKTQEEIASMLGTSSRSVSRWENGNTMPDLALLVELSDYYEVDIREIIDGERKAENVDKESKETLLKIADYADKQKNQAIIRAIILFGMEMVCCGLTIALGLVALRSEGKISVGYAVAAMLITFFFSGALIINARSYVRKVIQKKEE